MFLWAVAVRYKYIQCVGQLAGIQIPDIRNNALFLWMLWYVTLYGRKYCVGVIAHA